MITSVSTTALPIERVPFPAVTICAQGLVQQIVSSAITDKFRSVLKQYCVAKWDVAQEM